ncbi:MAG: efflux RND transporter permease subunit [Candidatus Marinimicrobia bacterium]|nr:efflux RND transporter permease subunit [Candidatus Neomarinimicrobiota bacterium]
MDGKESSGGGLNTIFNITTTRPVAISMIALAVVVFGYVSYQQLSLNLMPDISYPTLTVRTEYLGAAPEEVETTVSRPAEQALGVVGNLVNLTSISKAGVSDVVMEYTWDTDMNVATQDIREKLDQIRFPDGVERPLILRYDPSLDPIIRVGLYGGDDLFEIRKIAEEDIKRDLETIPGVAAVKVKGGLEREIRVELDEQQITLMGLNIRDVSNLIGQENINLAGGNLKEGQTEYLVRTLNEFTRISDISDLVVRRTGDVEIRIKDIGTVRETHKDREVITRIGGNESVEIEIYKEADANIVAVAERVRDKLYGTPRQQAFVKEKKGKEEKEKKRKEELKRDGGEKAAAAAAAEEKKEKAKKEEKKKERKRGAGRRGRGQGTAMMSAAMTDFISHNLPEGISMSTLSDQSTFIKNAIDEVLNTAMIGALLAVIVLFVFLRKASTTLIVAIAIPLSIVATFAPMHIFSVSLNIMSLGGLALGVGMLVDNSIVVLESIFRCREEGDGLVESSVRGVKEVGTAVFASTLTTIAVFFPIVFVEGVAGQIFGDLSLTVVFSLIASVAVALFLIPMLASRELDISKAGISIDKIKSMNFMRFRSLENLRALSEDKSSTLMDKLAGYPLNTMRLLGEFGFKFVLMVSVIILITLKVFLIILFTLLSPIISLISLKVKRWKGFNPALIRWSASDRVFRLIYQQKIWEGLLQFELTEGLTDGLSGYLKGFRKPVYYAGESWKLRLRRTVRALLLPLVTIYFVLRFLIGLLGSLIARLGIAFMNLLMLIGIFLWSITGLILMPFIKFIVYLFELGYDRISEWYPGAIRWSLDNKGAVIGTAAVLFLISVFVLIPTLGTDLIPQVHQGEFNVDVYLPVGTRLEETDSKLKIVENRIRDEAMIGELATVVGAEKSANLKSDEGEHTGKVTVKMVPEYIGAENEILLINNIRRKLADIPGIVTKISRPALFSFKTPIEVEVQGYDLSTLKRMASIVENRMNEISGLTDVKSNIQTGNPEVQIIYDRKLLAKYGLNISEVARIVRNKVKGEVASRFKDEDRRIDILVRVKEEDKESIDALRRLVVNPGGQVPIYLNAIAEIRIGEGPSEIRRVDQQRVALITANTAGIDLGSAMERISEALNGISWPYGFSYVLSGQNKEMETSMDSLIFALLLAVFLVYVVMASQFESLIHPFVIMFTIPLALIGVVAVLWLLSIPLSVVVFLGLIMLAGIVVNNAIVLVDYINRLRAKGMNKIEAIVTAGSVRLRPILMTTATTVLGLLPMALGLGEGAEIRTPMAITVVAGLISSTILTLLVIPTVYALVDRKD